LDTGIFKNQRFYLWVTIISIAGFFTRYLNINYASLWADELYSALLANPSNSWYEVLYIQRAYQPPLYAFSLWMWVQIFEYNEFYIRLFTLLAGVISIPMSAALGKKIHSERLGIIIAVIVAFSPVQIWYSIEARFYVFVYLFAAMSLWLYWHILIQKKVSVWVYVLKAFIDAALCYFHHFGIIFVFAQFFYDALIYLRTKEITNFLLKLGGYFISALLYLPWVLWGLSEAIKVEQYWLKEINIPAYLEFPLGYPTFVNFGCIILIGYFLFWATKKTGHNLFFPLICFIITLVPVVYSYLMMPMLVARYAMVMAPAVYIMIAFGIMYLLDFLKSYSNRFSTIAIILLSLIFILPGLYLSFVDKTKIDKQPWREMGNYLNQQQDKNEVKVYSWGAYVKDKKNIDFYLKSKQHSYDIKDIIPGKERKMYLVETDGIWKINDSVIKRIASFYIIQKKTFYEGSKMGSIYICTIKVN
jgi:uncharacterized membrane protein